MDFAFVPDALALAHREADKIGGSLTAANARLSRGKVLHGNLGHRQCTSGTLLTIQLIGSFPIAYTGTPGGPHPPVHGVRITADAVSGKPCLLSVQPGHVRPDHGSLFLFNDRVEMYPPP